MSGTSIAVEGEVAIVRLDRPKANALEHDLCVGLRDALVRARGSDVKAVVLTGTGRFFSAGLDLFAVFEYAPERAEAFANAFDDMIEGWFTLEKPVIAAVNGHAIAGGAVLAATADFRLVADDPALKMGLTEVQVGVPFPTSALEAVRFACAGPRLAELLLRGKTYGGAEAVAARLADELVSGDVVARARELARELGNLRAEAYASSKRALRAEFAARMRAARAAGTDPVWERWRAPDLRAVMEQFRDARVGR